MTVRATADVRVALAFVSIGGLVACLIAAGPGTAAWARDALEFSFAAPPPQPSDVASIFLSNTRVLAIPLLAALPPARALARAVTDVIVAVALAPSVIVIGVALGAYGTRLMPWLPHFPLELLATSISAGTYLRARNDSLGGRGLVLASLLVILALAIGAWIEVYLTPHC